LGGEISKIIIYQTNLFKHVLISPWFDYIRTLPEFKGVAKSFRVTI
jgi:hypothetical protein